MSDEMEPNGRVTFRDLYAAIEDSRKETKQDIKDMKEEVLDALNKAVEEFRREREAHALLHSTLEREGTEAFQAHLRSEEIEGARNRGRIDTFTMTAAFINKNWKGLLIILGFAVLAVSDLDLAGVFHHWLLP